jgi:HK97 family phage portal protein
MGVLSRLFTKANTVLPGVKLTDQALVRFMSDGGTSHTGRSVTVDSALTLDVVWACVRLISQTIATLPLGLFRQIGGGNRTPARDHPLYALLHDQPNYDMTSVEFWEAMVACVLLWGNSYARIDRNGVGTVIGLLPLMPDRMMVRRHDDGSIGYIFRDFAGHTQEYEEGDILHIKGFGFNGLYGLSPIQYARHNLGAALATEEASAKVFVNGMRPSGVMSLDATFRDENDQKRAHAKLAAFQGSTNTGKVPLLEKGWSFQSLSIPPEDAQLLQTKQLQVEQVARWFGVDPSLIGHASGSSGMGTGVEQRQIQFYTQALRPLTVRIEKSIAKALIAPAERGVIFAEFSLEGLLRGDTAARAALYASALQNGWMKANEVRALENLPPDPDGDVLTVQSNLVLRSQVGKQPADQTPGGFGLPQGPQAAAATQAQAAIKQ